MIFSSPSKPLLKTSDISWFNGSLKGTNPCLKPMVYTAGTNPAFFFVDYALLDKHKKNYGSNAASFYNKAANYKPNKYFSPVYLMKEALAYEKLNQNDKAIKVYQKIVDEYWESSEMQNAKKYKARLEVNS